MPDTPEPLLSARAAVERSDKFQGSGYELRSLRDALRALIQHAENQEERLSSMEQARLNDWFR